MYREICVFKSLELTMNPDFLLKGKGVTVEIDKSKFGRRNGLWGHSKENSKVSSRALLIPVPNRTRETSFSIIQRWIKPGIPHALNLDAICLRREQENDSIEAIFWNISVGSNSTKVPLTKDLEDC
ncbi:hypothetical protein RF11_11003 [Thelohanellus kitauei]|uniref:Uncharacterized protein n=1 Tax=Thelohanellus kitauei TaxID=669202 RepID=A0A0C2IUC7_THEKT|nr:hypothetical protein RF11_11003 [Thelohanellus kitauei]